MQVLASSSATCCELHETKWLLLGILNLHASVSLPFQLRTTHVNHKLPFKLLVCQFQLILLLSEHVFESHITFSLDFWDYDFWLLLLGRMGRNRLAVPIEVDLEHKLLHLSHHELELLGTIGHLRDRCAVRSHKSHHGL